LELLYQTPEQLQTDRFVTTHLKEILRRNCREGYKVLTLPDSMRFLEAYKMPILKTNVAKTPQEALDSASELGFPVVMKALSPQFTHKSEIDGVVLNVC
jgi:acetyltransferase